MGVMSGETPASLSTKRDRACASLSMPSTFTSTPLELRTEITAALGYKAEEYWNTLNEYLCGRISRVEYDELIREAVDNPQLGMFILGHYVPFRFSFWLILTCSALIYDLFQCNCIIPLLSLSLLRPHTGVLLLHHPPILVKGNTHESAVVHYLIKVMTTTTWIPCVPRD
jgi:hypothetical protein